MRSPIPPTLSGGASSKFGTYGSVRLLSCVCCQRIHWSLSCLHQEPLSVCILPSNAIQSQETLPTLVPTLLDSVTGSLDNTDLFLQCWLVWRSHPSSVNAEVSLILCLVCLASTTFLSTENRCLGTNPIAKRPIRGILGFKLSRYVQIRHGKNAFHVFRPRAHGKNGLAAMSHFQESVAFLVHRFITIMVFLTM